MLISCTIRRVVRTFSRYSAMLLVRVSETSVKRGAVAAENEYTRLRPYIIVFTDDVLPSFDPRLRFVLDVVETPLTTPFTLDGAERLTQASASKLASDAEGRVLGYRACACIAVAVSPSATGPLTLAHIKAMLPAGQQPAFQRATRSLTTAPAATSPEMYALLRTALPTLSSAQYATLWTTFASVGVSAEYVALVCRGVANPAALGRLSAVELLNLHTYVEGVVATLDPEDPDFIARVTLALGRFADCLPLELVGTRRRLRPCVEYERTWATLPDVGPLDAFVNAARLSQSTRGFMPDLGQFPASLLKHLPFLVPLAAGEVAIARDAEFEAEAARLLVTMERVLVVAAAGDVYADVWPRLTALDVEPTDAVFVAPTPAHAAAFPFEVLAVDDVLAGRVAHARAAALVLLVAHAYGADSFVHCVRAFTTSVLVLVGDPYDANGSPRDADRGAVLRDAVAAARRGLLRNCALEAMYGLSAAAPTALLSRDEVEALRRYREPTLADRVVCYVPTLADVPADVRAAGVVLVGEASMARALTLTDTYAASHAVGTMIVFESLGQVAPVLQRLRLRAPVRGRVSLAALDVVDEPLPLTTLGGYVLLDPHAATSALVDHRYCCRTTLPTLASLSMHAASVRAWPAAPARLLARTSPLPIADTLAFVLTDRTGIEDVRAAAALVRTALVVVGDATGLAAACARHAVRARTQLVEMLAAGECRRRLMLAEPLGLIETPPWPLPPTREPMRTLFLGATREPFTCVYARTHARSEADVYAADADAQLVPYAAEVEFGESPASATRLQPLEPERKKDTLKEGATDGAAALKRKARDYLNLHGDPPAAAREKEGKEAMDDGDDASSDDDFIPPSALAAASAAAPAAVPAEGGAGALAQRHSVAAFDGRCFLYEAGEFVTLADGRRIEGKHTYVVDGRDGYTSGTTFLHQFFDEFDAERASAGMVASPRWPDNVEYYGPATDAANTTVRAAWAEQFAPRATPPFTDVADLFLSGAIDLDALFAHCADRALADDLRRAYANACAEHIRDMWAAASEAGTAFHAAIEHFLDGATPRAELEAHAARHAEMRQFLRWYDTWAVPRGYTPYRVELRIIDEEHKICGSIDAIFYHAATNTYIIVDWKRTKALTREGYTRVPLADADADGLLYRWQATSIGRYAKRCAPPLEALYSDKYTTYHMQQLLYKYILERYTPMRISALYLLVCYPKQGDRYDLVPLPLDDTLMPKLFAFTHPHPTV